MPPSRKELGKAETAYYQAQVAYLKAWVLNAFKTGDFGEEFSFKLSGMSYGLNGDTPSAHYELRIPTGDWHELAGLVNPLGVKVDLTDWCYADFSHETGKLHIELDAAFIQSYPKAKATIMSYIDGRLSSFTLSHYELNGNKLTMEDLKKLKTAVF